MSKEAKMHLELKDREFPFSYTDHDREIVRGIVFDEEKNFYFVRIYRDDSFGKATLIETSGGGVEKGEDLETAMQRELKEELGAEVEILREIGIVSDYYNLIHRHNINHYFLCKALSFGEKNLMPYEIREFHMETLKLSYEEAIKEYKKCSNTKLGRLIAQREVPVLEEVKKMLLIN
jgi:MutT/NUDIX family protein